MSNRRLLKLLSVGCIAVLAGSWQKAHAATLEVGTLSAQTDGQTPVTATYSTTPYVTPVTSTVVDASSTVTPDSTGLVFKGTFTQSANGVMSPAAAPTAAGAFDVKFSANTGDTYSLFGGVTPVDGTGTLSVSLFDNSTNTSIYSYSNTGEVAITADGTGGPTAGLLTAGDYTFTLDSSLAGSVYSSFITGPAPAVSLPGATLAGSGGVTLVSSGVLPEPSAPILLLVAGVALLLTGRRRTASETGRT